MKNLREEKFKGYKVLFFPKDYSIPTQLVLSEEKFNERKHLLNWIDFLIKTEQWVPYNLYKDAFDIHESVYEENHLDKVTLMEITYEDYYLKTQKVNLDEE